MWFNVFSIIIFNAGTLLSFDQGSIVLLLERNRLCVIKLGLQSPLFEGRTILTTEEKSLLIVLPVDNLIFGTSTAHSLCHRVSVVDSVTRSLA